MIEDIYRKDTTVCIDINTNLGTCKPIYVCGWKCSTQEEAELLARHLRVELRKSKKKIARDAILFLNSYETSDLKRKLSKWSLRKDEWI